MLISRLAGGTDDRMFLQWKVYTGSNFAESFEGTNGLGTALAEQKPILVHREEHFRLQGHLFCCAVAPRFYHAGCLVGAANISACRAVIELAAHQLPVAVAIGSSRLSQGSNLRAH